MSRKQKIYFQSALLLLAAWLLVRPMITKLAGNWSSQRQLTKRLQLLTAKRDTLAGIEPGLIDERVKKMEAVFPSVKPVVPLLATLSQLAGQYNLSFGGVSLAPGSLSQAQVDPGKKKPAAAGLEDLSFGFQVGGDFAQISRFLQALENTAPLMRVDELGLTIKSNPLLENQLIQVRAEIKVSAYYQAPPKSLGSLETPVKLLNKNEETLLNQLVGFKTFPAVLPQAFAGKEDLFAVQPALP